MTALRIGVRSELGTRVVHLQAEEHTKIHELAQALQHFDVTQSGTAPPDISGGLPTLVALTPDRGVPYRVDPLDTVSESGLRSGCEIWCEDEVHTRHLPSVKPRAGRLTVTHISGAVATFSLRTGDNSIGRYQRNRIVLPGESVPQDYGVLRVETDSVVLETWGETESLQKIIPDQPITIGDYRAVYETLIDRDIASPTEFAQEWWQRPPHTPGRYVAPRIRQESFQLPQEPDPPTKPPLPWVAITIPIVLGLTLFALTRSPFTLMIIAFSPIFALSSWADQRLRRRKSSRNQAAEHQAAVQSVYTHYDTAKAEELNARIDRAPGILHLERAVLNSDAVVWSQISSDTDTCEIRLGIGPVRATHRLEQQSSSPETLPELKATQILDDAPVSVPSHGIEHIGVVGTPMYRTQRLKEIVLQQCVLYSPAHLQLLVVHENRFSPQVWDWTHWLPHLPPPTSTDLDSKLRTLHAEIDRRRSGQAKTKRLLVVCDVESREQLARFKTVADSHPSNGVEYVWAVPDARSLPRTCHTWVAEQHASADPTGELPASILCDAQEAEQHIIRHEHVNDAQFTRTARELAALWTGTGTSNTNSLPDVVNFDELQGIELLRRPDELRKRWQDSTRTASVSLAVPIGVGNSGPMMLDIAAHGPHALVCGMTGAGKSEFLQNWILSLAARYSPNDVRFLLIDFKGGATFEKLGKLPHASGLLTDLADHLVERVLKALQAELKLRELLFQKHHAHDLATMRRTAAAAAPPQLMIVVDEYATLIEDNPGFIDGIVDVAQRGRSLGVHLILSTQHPGRAVTAAIRANTNLRIALRTASAEDSQQIIDSPLAAQFSGSAPGRAAIRIGSEPPATVQTGLVGQHAGRAAISIVQMDSSAAVSEIPTSQAPNESTRDEVRALTKVFNETAQQMRLPSTNQLWQDPLAANIPLASLTQTVSGADQQNTVKIPLGRADRPEQQLQPVFSFDLSSERHCLIVGSGGSGKTETLVTLAASAIAHRNIRIAYITSRQHPALSLLEKHPHTIAVAYTRQAANVTRLLRAVERHVNSSHDHTVPRTMLLIDDVEELLDTHEMHPEFRWEHSLSRILHDGPQAAVHVGVTARRMLSLNSTTRAAFDRQIVLPLLSPGEYAQFGIREPMASERIPGRAHILPENVLAQIAHTSLADLQQQFERLPIPHVQRSTELFGFGNAHQSQTAVATNLETGGSIELPHSGVCVISGSVRSGRAAVSEILMLAAAQQMRNGDTELDVQCLTFDTDQNSVKTSHGSEDVTTVIERIVQSRNKQIKYCIRVSAEAMSESGEISTQIAASFQRLQHSPHFILIEHDPSDSDVNWALQRKLESASLKVLLWHNAADPRSLAAHVRKPPFPLETLAGQGLIEAGKELTPVQFQLDPRKMKAAA